MPAQASGKRACRRPHRSSPGPPAGRGMITTSGCVCRHLAHHEVRACMYTQAAPCMHNLRRKCQPSSQSTVGNIHSSSSSDGSMGMFFAPFLCSALMSRVACRRSDGSGRMAEQLDHADTLVTNTGTSVSQGRTTSAARSSRRVRRWSTAYLIAAALVVAALIGVYFPHRNGRLCDAICRSARRCRYWHSWWSREFGHAERAPDAVVAGGRERLAIVRAARNDCSPGAGRRSSAPRHCRADGAVRPAPGGTC